MLDLEEKVLRQYKRRQRRQRWIAWAPKLVAWVIGLDLTTTIVYGGDLVYQRVLDDEKRLNALFEKNARARKAAQASARAAATPSMTVNDIWMPGTWSAPRHSTSTPKSRRLSRLLTRHGMDINS